MGCGCHSHESFVGVADFLDVDVKLGVDEGLDGAVGVGDGHHRRHVLEVVGRLDAHLAEAAVRVADLHHGR